MSNDKLVRIIKDAGCRVRFFDKDFIGGDAAATFDTSNAGPIICVASRGRDRREIRRLLLHEFGHFYQWKTGFMQTLDGICDSWGILNKRIRGKKVSQDELDKAVKVACLLEYDAELRSIEIADTNGIWINRREVYDDAHSYISGIKYSAIMGRWVFYPGLNIRHSMMTPREVIAPLTKEEKKLISENE